MLLNAVDATTWFRDTSISASVETAETTTYGVAGGSKTYLAGLSDATLSLTGLFEDSTGGADETIAALLGSDTPIVFTVAQDGGLTAGRRCVLGSSIETKYDISSPVADVVSTSLDLQQSAETARGVVLEGLSTVSATGTTTAIDNTTSTTNGGVATIHVTANTRNGTIIAKIQHSADNVTFADLATFATISTATTTAERISVAAGTTVNRYLRVSYTVAGSSGSATIAVAFGRRP